MFKMILAHFVELAQKLLIIYFMNVFILTSFGKISNIWFALSGKHVEFSLQDVLIGKLDKVSDLLNYFLIVAKWYIWTSRKRSLRPDIAAFKEMINMKCKTEKYIAVKTTRKGNFRPTGNYILIVNYGLILKIK